MAEMYLTELQQGEEAVIIEILGGRGLKDRLNALGLGEGQRIRKLAKVGWHGPVILVVNRAQIAIGRGMARKIVVKTNGNG